MLPHGVDGNAKINTCDSSRHNAIVVSNGCSVRSVPPVAMTCRPVSSAPQGNVLCTD